MGILLYGQREYAEAGEYIKAALEMSHNLGDAALTATLTGNLASIITEQGDLDGAWRLQHEALSARRALGDDLGVASTLSNLGTLAYRRSEYAQARAYFEEGLEINRAEGDIGSAIIALSNLGSTMIAQGDWTSAVPILMEGLKIAHELGEREIIISCAGGLSEVAYAQIQLERAVLLDAASEAMRQEIGQALHPDDQERQDRYRATLRNEVGEVFERLWNEGKAMALDRAIEYALAVDAAVPGGAEPSAQVRRPVPSAGVSVRSPCWSRVD